MCDFNGLIVFGGPPHDGAAAGGDGKHKLFHSKRQSKGCRSVISITQSDPEDAERYRGYMTCTLAKLASAGDS